MTVTKMELANTLFEELGLNKREAREFVELFFEEIRKAIAYLERELPRTLH